MQICKIIGTITSTVKNDHFVGKKIMIVQPLDLEGKADGKDFLALDTVDAGINDRVLVMKEGGSARIVLQDKEIPIQALILAIVDEIDIVEKERI